MGVKTRSGEENVTGGRVLKTGATFIEVVAISPTVEEMQSVLGFDNPTAPNSCVDTDNDGKPRVRIDMWFQRKEDDFLYKECFFITKTPNVSQAGNYEWINDYGQKCYSKEGEEPSFDWFRKEGMRLAFQGERNFIDFMKVWTNHNGKNNAETIFFDDWNKMFEGDFTELKEIMVEANKLPNVVGVLFGVRDVDTDSGTKQYQTSYKKLYGRSYQNLATIFRNKLKEEYGAFNHDYQNDVTWKDYNPSNVDLPSTAQDATANLALEDDPWG